jgi:hypothetical protein
MQYLLLIYEDEKALQERDEETWNEIFGQCRAFTASVREAGQFVAADALQPTTTATSVRVRDGKTITTDGPFAETKEQLGGYGPFHAARADFCRTTGRRREAEDAYKRAIALATNDPERRFLERRLQEVRSGYLD